jgi:hypothetical protein
MPTRKSTGYTLPNAASRRASSAALMHTTIAEAEPAERRETPHKKR